MEEGACPTDSLLTLFTPSQSSDSEPRYFIQPSWKQMKDTLKLCLLYFTTLSYKAKQEPVIHKDQRVPLIPKRDQKGCFFTNMHDIYLAHDTYKPSEQKKPQWAN